MAAPPPADALPADAASVDADATPLAQRRCRALEGQAALGPPQVQALLTRVDGWAVVDGALEKRFAFADYRRTMAFVAAVAAMADEQDHHPELRVVWGRCTVRWDTHSVGGLSANDFICAARCDALAGASPV